LCYFEIKFEEQQQLLEMARSNNADYQLEQDLLECYEVDVDWFILPPQLREVSVQKGN
jgi:hypothetical protein